MSVHSQKDRNRGIKKPLRFQLGHRTSESTCDALGEGWGYAFLFNVVAKLAFLWYLVVYFVEKL